MKPTVKILPIIIIIPFSGFDFNNRKPSIYQSYIKYQIHQQLIKITSKKAVSEIIT